ncbi:unnamed protein product [Haemonchus placei]|uniref:Protein kinase domain-containing protein n=1 Tax=Haemonchus placei TaxID=6290 RepID=A0A0N4W3X6_HAEPC|nr:unnamed protein product [Haemonchus placei]
MAFSPAKVVTILLAEFGTSEDSTEASREERKVAGSPLYFAGRSPLRLMSKPMNAWSQMFLRNLTRTIEMEMVTKVLARRANSKLARRKDRREQNGSHDTYTILPVIYADGKLGKKLYVVLQEKENPRQGYFKAPDLVVRAGTTHIMTKELMVDWIRNCLFASRDGHQELHLIAESWSSFRDTNTIR